MYQISFIIFLISFIFTQNITLTYPNGGEEFTTGSQIDIQWTTDGSVSVIDLSYSSDNGATWTAIDIELENNDIYAWDIPLNFTEGAEYLIKVFDNVDGSPYDISDNPFSIISNCDDPQEPNDSSNMYPLELGIEYNGCYAGTSADDQDWFTFNSGDGGLFEASIIQEDAQYPILSMYNGVDWLIDSNTSYGDLSVSSYIEPNITVWLYTYTLIGSGPYTLTVNEVESNCSDSFEPNDSFSEASTISYGQTVSGCIESFTDMDYFSFNASSGEAITVEVDVESIESNLEGYYIELWNGTDELIYENYDQTPGTNIAITHEIQQSGTYYIKLYTTALPGAYQLQVNDQNSLSIDDILLNTYAITGVYPNPFNPTTTITYQLPEFASVSIDVYNLNGQLVESLYKGFKSPGEYSINWNAVNVISGVYIVTMTSGTFVETQKVMLLK